MSASAELLAGTSPSLRYRRRDPKGNIEGTDTSEIWFLRAYGLMGFDALNIGHREAQLSATQFRQARKDSPVPLLSANLLDAYRLVQRNGRTIAPVGVLDPRGLGENLGEGLAVEKMEVALARLLPELRTKADLVVLLAFTDETTLAALAREFHELDVVLGGKVSQPSQQLGRKNRAVILHVTNESRALGILKAKFAGKAKLTDVSHEITLMREAIPQHDAFATLVVRKADADPNCIDCHTVGFGSASGYRREFAGKKLADVGCESCHGPGSLLVEQHRAKLPITLKFRPLGAGDCRKCHHDEFSRPFDWEVFWPHIKHGKEPLAR